MSVKIIPAYNHEEEIGNLFNEYTNMVIDGAPEFKNYLDQQNYDEEIKHLEDKYGLPYGRLYIAYVDDKAAGCIGLKRIDEKNCEMKRLYVKSEFRGQKIGQQLIEKIIADAREIGYSHMPLDTLPFLKSAIHMYKQFGFYEIESYNNSPMQSLIYMKLDL